MKITELTEERVRTTYTRDAYGNRIRGQEEFTAFRPVKTVKEGPRFGHFFIDIIAFNILMTTIDFILNLFHISIPYSHGSGLTFMYVNSISGLLLYPFMYFICEYLWQRTPGKFLTKTVVIDEYGKRPDIPSLIARSLIRLVPFEAFSCFGTHSRGWHDKWSNTYVVAKEELEEIQALLKIQDINRNQ